MWHSSFCVVTRPLSQSILQASRWSRSAPAGLVAQLHDWPLSSSCKSDTNAVSASVRAVKRTSPKCSSAERTTNKFSTSCERNKQSAESQTGLQTYKGRKPPEKQGRFHSSVQLHLRAGSTITESNSIFILFVWSAILLLFNHFWQHWDDMLLLSWSISTYRHEL